MLTTTNLLSAIGQFSNNCCIYFYESIDKCVFNKPAREGQLLKIYGTVESIGNTSINLKLEARSHNVYNGKQNVILATNITFVRVDEMGDAIPISERVNSKFNNTYIENVG